MVHNTRYIAIYEKQEKQKQQDTQYLNAHIISFQINLVSRHYERPPSTTLAFRGVKYGN